MKICTAIMLLLFGALVISACGMPINRLPLYQRSATVQMEEDEARIVAKASMEKAGPNPYDVRVLYLAGTPYEMGFQHGRLLRDEIHRLYDRVMLFAGIVIDTDILDEAYDLMDPYIPLEEKEEMRGLAHGAGVPLRVVHWMHAIPEVYERDDREKFSRLFKGTSCSNIAAFGKATADGKIYHLRVLDWIRPLGAQKCPTVLVHKPDVGYASVTFSYAGFIGCISGMNDQRMSFGEKGSGAKNESLEGMPFIFLFRKLMREAGSIADVERIVRETPRTCGYQFMFTDAKATDNAAKILMLNVDHVKMEVFGNDNVGWRAFSGGNAGFEDILYVSARPRYAHDLLQKHYGTINPGILMKMAKSISMDSNMQNVVFAPGTLEAWVSNADTSWWGNNGRACFQKWFYFNFTDALKRR